MPDEKKSDRSGASSHYQAVLEAARAYGDARAAEPSKAALAGGYGVVERARAAKAAKATRDAWERLEAQVALALALDHRRLRKVIVELDEQLCEWGINPHLHAGRLLSPALRLRRLRGQLFSQFSSKLARVRPLLRRVARVCKREGDELAMRGRAVRAVIEDFRHSPALDDDLKKLLEEQELDFMSRAEDLWTCAHLARSLLGPGAEPPHPERGWADERGHVLWRDMDAHLHWLAHKAEHTPTAAKRVEYEHQAQTLRGWCALFGHSLHEDSHG